MMVFAEADLAVCPFPIARGWHLHWTLLEAGGATVQGEAQAIRNVSPSCVFPICLSCINTQDPTMWDQRFLLASWAAHTAARSFLCVRMGG